MESSGGEVATLLHHHTITPAQLVSKQQKMKLKLRPNKCKLDTRSRGSICANIATSLSLICTVFVHILLVACLDSSHQLIDQQQLANSESNKGHHQSNFTSIGRDVTNLHLTPDFRAVKLRWSYEHNDNNQPASFDIKFCELTSWNIEIKCRHREMMVEHELVNQQPQRPQRPRQGLIGNNNNKVMDNSVIGTAPSETVHQLEPPAGPDYEAQIFDLRALTNYTFQVQVSRFEHEPRAPVAVEDGKLLVQDKRRNRGQSARRLQQQEPGEQRLVRRIETKPFGAEATKCLADVSEVLINTGRYFGGRISVEDSSDPRCHLIGNKTSEQSTYLFKIDHEICASKTVDGNRIETMVLVHENKDILTHNTARFLVLCNFLQKSFTLRASVSLPKVNGLVAGNTSPVNAPPANTRPAVITSLPRYHLPVDQSELPPTSVMLGSMPGVYRARVPHANNEIGGGSSTESSLKQASGIVRQQVANLLLAELEHANRATTTNQHLKPAVNNRQPLDELESNTIERKFVEKDSLERLVSVDEGQATTMAATPQHLASSPASAAQRQAKELAFSSNNNNNNNRLANLVAENSRAANLNSNHGIDGVSRARSLMLLAPDQVAAIPQDGGGGKFLQQPATPPSPVQVQSKVLYIERLDSLPVRSAKQQRVGQDIVQQLLRVPQQLQQQQQQQQQHTTTNSVESSGQQIDTPEPRTATTSALASFFSPSAAITAHPTPPLPVSSTTTTSSTVSDRHRKQQSAKLSEANSDELTAADLQQPPVIMTNNHRVTGDYLPVAQLMASQRSAATPQLRKSSSHSPGVKMNDNNNDDNNDGGEGDRMANFTIKYSANRVDDFPVDNQVAEQGSPMTMMMMRARSGRMRSIGDGSLRKQQQQPPHVARPTESPTTTTLAPDLSPLGDNFRHPISGWSVNRMGEALSESGGSNVDLMAETSNETSNQVMLGNSSQTLAQNITGALLRWSLKTLTNLARKSLESLIIPDHNSNGTASFPSADPFSNHTYGQPISELDGSAPSTWRWESPTTPAVAEPSKRPITIHRTTSLPPAPTTTTTRVRLPTTTRASTVDSRTHGPADFGKSTSGSLVDELPAIDGFLMNPKPSGHATTRQPHTRPSNYSKSLDLSRLTESGEKVARLGQRNQGEKISAVSGRLAGQKLASNISSQTGGSVPARDAENQAARLNDSVWSNRDTFYSSWLFYGILMFVALVTAVFLTICLLSAHQAPGRRSTLAPEMPRGGGVRTLGFNCDPSLAGLGVFGGTNVSNSIHGHESRGLVDGDSTYQKYDYNKFENYSSETIGGNNNNKRGLLGGSGCVATANRSLSRQSPSEVSHTTTRSTSANSTLTADENDCKNNEFLYTEHVLINTGSSFGQESYA